MKRWVPYSAAWLAAGAAAAMFARTGPGAVVHAAATMAATALAFYLPFVAAAGRGELRRELRRRALRPDRPARILPPGDDGAPLEPGRELTTEEIAEHWHDDAGLNVGER